MRADSAGAKTWLLGAIALWALCVWVLALFGLGGEVDRLDADPSLLQPLPPPLPPLPERLGPLPQYSEIGQRPLFSENRRPQPFVINPDGADDQASFDYVLTSVLIAPEFRMAILQPAGGGESVRLELGDAPESAPGWTLAAIDARSVLFNGPEGERELELRVFDGVGGQPPTPMTVDSGGRRGQAGRGARPSMSQPAPDAMAPPMSDPAMQADADGAPRPEDDTPDEATPDESRPSPSSEQIDAIRARIEARRRKLREEQQQPSSGKTP